MSTRSKDDEPPRIKTEATYATRHVEFVGVKRGDNVHMITASPSLPLRPRFHMGQAELKAAGEYSLEHVRRPLLKDSAGSVSSPTNIVAYSRYDGFGVAPPHPAHLPLAMRRDGVGPVLNAAFRFVSTVDGERPAEDSSLLLPSHPAVLQLVGASHATAGPGQFANAVETARDGLTTCWSAAEAQPHLARFDHFEPYDIVVTLGHVQTDVRGRVVFCYAPTAGGGPQTVSLDDLPGRLVLVAGCGSAWAGQDLRTPSLARPRAEVLVLDRHVPGGVAARFATALLDGYSSYGLRDGLELLIERALDKSVTERRSELHPVLISNFHSIRYFQRTSLGCRLYEKVRLDGDVVVLRADPALEFGLYVDGRVRGEGAVVHPLGGDVVEGVAAAEEAWRSKGDPRLPLWLRLSDDAGAPDVERVRRVVQSIRKPQGWARFFGRSPPRPTRWVVVQPSPLAEPADEQATRAALKGLATVEQLRLRDLRNLAWANLGSPGLSPADDERLQALVRDYMRWLGGLGGFDPRRAPIRPLVNNLERLLDELTSTPR